MISSGTMKRTPLHDTHVALHARMVDFAGWQMPIQYRTGINEEHNAVRDSCGIFDVSHMGQIRITGDGAVDFLRYVALNDAARLKVGRAQYSMLPNNSGGLIDDIYVYRDGESDFMIVSNAGNHDSVMSHLDSLSKAKQDVDVSDESADWAVLAVQGPEATRILSEMTGQELDATRKNATEFASIAGHEIRLTRTGYTGEAGFEVYTKPEAAVPVWQALTASGAVPCGLGARDTLRLEAGFPLFGNELDANSNPLCTPMAWVVKDKDFFGRPEMMNADCARRLVGLELLQRGIPRGGYAIVKDGRQVGTVTSGTISPWSRKAIALGWLDSGFSEPGTELAVEIRGQPVEAVVAELPFIRK